MTSPEQSYRLIPLSRGLFCKVSPIDFERLSQYQWYAMKNACMGTFYAARHIAIGVRKQGLISMHREILGLPRTGRSVVVDHINGDTLDNRRENIRIANRSQNSMNTKLRTDSQSRFKGVNRRGDGRWRARIFVEGKHVHLGDFRSAEEAHNAYCIAASKYFGQFARFQ